MGVQAFNLHFNLIYNLRSTVSLKQPKCNTVIYDALNSFQYKGAQIWNDLPNKGFYYIS